MDNTNRKDDDFYIVSKNETMEQIDNAEAFLESVKNYLEKGI